MHNAPSRSWVFFVSAVLVAAWYGGRGPGLLATALSAAAGGYLLLPHDFGDRVRLVLFVLIGVMISIATEIKRRAERRTRLLAERLQDSNRQKDVFIATLAHELRTPMAPVRHAIEIVRLKNPSAPGVEWAPCRRQSADRSHEPADRRPGRCQPDQPRQARAAEARGDAA